MDKAEQRKCVQCGKRLSGRSDKRFCDDYCRNSYNNQNKRDDQRYILEVNSIIRRNRRILKSLCPVGKATVRKDVLDTMRYDFRYFSSIYKSSSKQVYFICYDYAFSPIKETKPNGKVVNKALIVQKQDYFDQLSLKIW